LKRASDFLTWLRENDVDYEGDANQDYAAADYMAQKAYQDSGDPNLGRTLLASLLHLYPSMKGKFFRAARGLASWSSLKLQRETNPIPREVCNLLGVFLMWSGFLWAALGIWMHVDMILREQDLEQMIYTDLSDDKQDISVTLGDPDRGETVKGGADQGATVGASWLKKIVRHLIRLRDTGVLKGSDRILMFSIEYYRTRYSEARVEAKMSPSRRAHELRHSAAAADVERQTSEVAGEHPEYEGHTTDREGTRRRGRWALLKSLQVYDKPHLLVRARANLDAAIWKLAQSVDSNGSRVAEQWIARLEEERRRRPHNFQRGRSRRATKEEIASLQAVEGRSPGASGAMSVGDPIQIW